MRNPAGGCRRSTPDGSCMTRPRCLSRRNRHRRRRFWHGPARGPLTRSSSLNIPPDAITRRVGALVKTVRWNLAVQCEGTRAGQSLGRARLHSSRLEPASLPVSLPDRLSAAYELVSANFLRLRCSRHHGLSRWGWGLAQQNCKPESRGRRCTASRVGRRCWQARRGSRPPCRQACDR